MATYGPVRLYPTTVVDSNSVGGDTNILTSNDIRATLNSNSDYVRVGGFSGAGLQGDEIISIKLGMEGQRSGGGLDPSIDLTYYVGAVKGQSEATGIPVGSTSDQDYPVGLLNVTADRPWLIGTIGSVEILLDRDTINTGFGDVDADSLFLEVLTQDTPQPTTIGEIHRIQLGTSAVNILPAGDLGAIYIHLKASLRNTSFVYVSHEDITDDPADEADTWHLPPGEPALPIHLSSSLLDQKEFWVKGQTPGQWIEYAIYTDEQILLQQEANGLLSQLVELLGLGGIL